MKKVILVGASGHSKVIVDILEKMENIKIIGYLDSYKKDATFFGYPIFGTEYKISELYKNNIIDCCIISIGDNFIRFKMYEKILKLEPKIQFCSAIHPKAILGRGALIGSGTVVMANAVINSDAKIGNHSIINTSAIIEHDSIIGDFSTISPNVSFGGGVQIGNFVFIGLNASIKHYIIIGNNVILGANSFANKNIDSNVLAYGTPAIKIKDINLGDKYL
jgi:sugar O-acyltransferase (sialic acid O-acetyltransferase NeuD family)